MNQSAYHKLYPRNLRISIIALYRSPVTLTHLSFASLREIIGFGSALPNCAVGVGHIVHVGCYEKKDNLYKISR